MTIIVEQAGADLKVHGLSKCGRRFSDVAAVIDWRGGNPLLQIPHPLGMVATLAIVAELSRLRLENKLTKTSLIPTAIESIRAALAQLPDDEHRLECLKHICAACGRLTRTGEQCHCTNDE